MPFENDGVITWELVIERFNSDLANILGNLVNRTISMSNKYFDGVVRKTGVTAEVDEDLKAVVTGTRDKVQEKMDKLRVADAITAVFDLFRAATNTSTRRLPGCLQKDEADHDRLAEVLYNLTESITIGAGLLHSFLPETAEKIVNQLNTTLRDYDDLDKFGLYESGSRVTDTPEILFARLDAKEVMPKVEEIKAAQKAEFEAEQKKLAGETETAEEAEESVIDIEPKAEIEYDDFMKMQFQVGEIIACEAVPKSKKLLCSQVKITVLPDERKAGNVFLYDCHTWCRACIRYCHGFFADDLCIGGPAVYLPVFYSDGGLSFLYQTDARAYQKKKCRYWS